MSILSNILMYLKKKEVKTHEITQFDNVKIFYIQT